MEELVEKGPKQCIPTSQYPNDTPLENAPIQRDVEPISEIERQDIDACATVVPQVQNQSSGGLSTKGEVRRKRVSILRLGSALKRDRAVQTEPNTPTGQRRRSLIRFQLDTDQTQLATPREETIDDGIIRQASTRSLSPERYPPAGNPPSPSSRPRGRLPSRLRRTSSSNEARTRRISDERATLPRSRSERTYRWQQSRGEQGEVAVVVANRRAWQSTRRWRADGYRTMEEEREGELDSFFRFMETCTQAAWNVILAIPNWIVQIPRVTVEFLQTLVPGVKRQNVPAIEPAPPADEDGEER